MRAFIAAIIASTFAVPTLAADCHVIYNSPAAVSVKNNMGSALLSGLVGGAVGALVADAASTANNSDNELYLRDKIQKINTFEILHSIHSNSSLPQGNVNNTDGCVINLTLNNIQFEYGASTVSVFGFNVKKSVDRKMLIDKNDDFRFNVSEEPFPNKPRRKFKPDRTGKFVEVTEPAKTKEVAYADFEKSYIMSIQKMFSKLLKKYNKQQ